MHTFTTTFNLFFTKNIILVYFNIAALLWIRIKKTYFYVQYIHTTVYSTVHCTVYCIQYCTLSPVTRPSFTFSDFHFKLFFLIVVLSSPSKPVYDLTYLPILTRIPSVEIYFDRTEQVN